MNALTDLPVLADPALRFATLPSGVQLPYSDCGAGEALLFVHGSLCDYRYWNSQVNVLSKQYRCLSVSLSHYWPGDGAAVQAEFSWETHVLELAAFIGAAGIGPVHLVGHSRGGCVAFQLARQYPHLVRTLTLADPGGPLHIDGTAPADLPAATIALRERAAALIDSGAVEEGLELFVDSVSMPGIWRRSPASFRAMAISNAATLPKQFRDPLPAYTRASAQQIGCPTLLIGGEKSPRMYRQNIEMLAGWIGHTDKRSIAGASHGMNTTNPAAFNRFLHAFLSQQRG